MTINETDLAALLTVVGAGITRTERYAPGSSELRPEALLVAAFFGLRALGLGEIWSILLLLALLCALDVLLFKWLVGKASRVYLLQEKFA